MPTETNESGRGVNPLAAVGLLGLLLAIPLGIVLVPLLSGSGPSDDDWARADEVLSRLEGETEESAARTLATELANIVEPWTRIEGDAGNRAKFLRTVGRAVIGSGDVAGALDEIELASIPVTELRDGAKVLFHARRFGPADRTIEAALVKTVDQPAAVRDPVLRVAMLVRFEVGRDDDVLDHVRELSELVPEDPSPHRAAAMVHRNRGHWDHFVDAAGRAVERSAGDAGVLRVELLDGYIRLGQTEDARREFDHVAKTNPELLPQMPLIRARLLMLEGETATADEILTGFLAKFPNDGEALVLRGKLLVGLGRFEQAVETLERGLERDPANEDAHYQLGQAHARLGDADRATEYLDKHRRILDAKVRLYEMERNAARQPKNVELRRRIAEEYAAIGMTDLADFWTRAAEAVAPDEG